MCTFTDDQKRNTLTELANAYMVLVGIRSFLQQEEFILKRDQDTNGVSDNTMAQSYLATAVRDLNIEIEELRIKQTIEWLGEYSPLRDSIEVEVKKIKQHLEDIQQAASKAQTAAQILAAVLEIIKLIAPLV